MFCLNRRFLSTLCLATYTFLALATSSNCGEALPTAAAAASTPPAMTPTDAKGEFRFDTGLLTGTLRAGGQSRGIGPVVEKKSGTQVAGHFGLFSHYRVLTRETRYGAAAWDWPSDSKLPADGSVEARWPSAPEHPLEITALYRWRAPDTLDVTTSVTPRQDLPKLELFLASYFQGFPSSRVYVRENPASGGKPGFMAAQKAAGDWQMFPRDEEAVAIIEDGRWKRPPNPVAWTIMPRLAAPLAIRRDAKSGLCAVLMAPAAACFAVAMPHEEEGHRSVYFSLFGRDVKAGSTATARCRLVIGRDMSDEKVLDLYRAYCDEQGNAP